MFATFCLVLRASPLVVWNGDSMFLTQPDLRLENVKQDSCCRDAKTWNRQAKIWLYGHLTPNDADHESTQQLQHDAKDFIPASLHIPEL